LEFAYSIGYKIIFVEKQNWYFDLTLIKKDNEEVRFALYKKTTFRLNDKTAGFTLGSHGGYFKERDKNKNIKFLYNQYAGHYCLGVIYIWIDVSDDLVETEIYQVQEFQEDYEMLNKKVGERSVTTVNNLKFITSVIKDFDFFASEKCKIARDKQGLGSTVNIGFVFDDIEEFKNEN
jgi:hypothetical protein